MDKYILRIILAVTVDGAISFNTTNRSSRFFTPASFGSIARRALVRLARSTYGARAITINGKAREVLLTTDEYDRLVRLAFSSASLDEEVLEVLIWRRLPD